MIPQAFSNTTFNDLFTPHVGWEDTGAGAGAGSGSSAGLLGEGET